MSEHVVPSVTDLATAAFEEAAQDVIRRAIETNTPVIVYQDGQIVKLDPRTPQPIASNPTTDEGHDPTSA